MYMYIFLFVCDRVCWDNDLGCIQCSQMYLVLFGSKSPSCMLYCIYCWKVATDSSLCRICIQSISVMTFERWYFWSTVHCISASHPIVSLWYNWCCQWLVTCALVVAFLYWIIMTNSLNGMIFVGTEDLFYVLVPVERSASTWAAYNAVRCI